jgi:hypothetical protein
MKMVIHGYFGCPNTDLACTWLSADFTGATAAVSGRRFLRVLGR